ncbi:MAG: GatB/YqeY domain-containing protein [Candidatus Neomarinimicrobiota bacterium]
MDLIDRLLQDMIVAMKAKDEDRLRIIRLLRSNIRKAEIDSRKEFTDEDVIGVLMSSAKQHQDSIQAYRNGGRADLVALEEAELVVIRTYLPQALTTAELILVVTEVIAETGATNIKDLGRVMSLVMAKVKGRTTGSEVQIIVRSKLT